MNNIEDVATQKQVTKNKVEQHEGILNSDKGAALNSISRVSLLADLAIECNDDTAGIPGKCGTIKRQLIPLRRHQLVTNSDLHTFVQC